MKTRNTVLITLLVAMSLALTGCLSGLGGTSPSVEDNKVTTVNMYVNIPTDTVGTATLALVKVTNGSFADPTSFSFTGTPDASATKPILSYYTYCQAVRASIAQISGNKNATVTFNTARDGNGYALDFSNTKAILRSLLIMAAYDATNVYAIYKY
ncbi:MAG TPA: hypothetical protein DCQ43_03590 [Treponema sp.]|jgi:hypothetical protein|nr:hypothetical protein [Treponema sp.]HBD68968.1 hypothetical protein [Treponema sp.]